MTIKTRCDYLKQFKQYMFTSIQCRIISFYFKPEDDHDHCPSCLGLEQLREGLSEDPCMNCTIMPRAVRAAEVELLTEGGLPPAQSTPAQPTHPSVGPQRLRVHRRRRGLSLIGCPPGWTYSLLS